MAFFNFFLDAFFRKIYGFRLCSKDMFIAELVNNSMFFKLLFYTCLLYTSLPIPVILHLMNPVQQVTFWEKQDSAVQTKLLIR